jgi:hypothetical protein
MASATMVERVPTDGDSDTGDGKREGGASTRPSHAKQSNNQKAAPWDLPNGVGEPRTIEKYGEWMMKETRGDAYKPVMRYVVKACWIAKVKQQNMHNWFLKASSSFRTSRLRGWRLWHDFCIGRHVRPEDMRTIERPDQLFASFITWLDNTGAKEHTKKGRTASSCGVVRHRPPRRELRQKPLLQGDTQKSVRTGKRGAKGLDDLAPQNLPPVRERVP